MSVLFRKLSSGECAAAGAGPQVVDDLLSWFTDQIGPAEPEFAPAPVAPGARERRRGIRKVQAAPEAELCFTI